MGSSAADLKMIGDVATVLGALAGILGGLAATAGLAGFFGGGTAS